jgi:hypothetical protein
MNLDLIYSSLKLIAPNMREFDVLAGITETLSDFNADGLETKTTLTVNVTTGTPESRTSNATYNYYTDKKCLIMPSTVILAEYLYVATQKYLPCSADEYLSGKMPSHTFFASDTGELYIAETLVKRDVVTIWGKHIISNLIQLPDYWIEYFKNGALEYYYRYVLKERDTAEEYKGYKKTAYVEARSHISQVLTPPNFKNNLLKA